jgi:uncharacterized damage-inducible protein DinB
MHPSLQRLFTEIELQRKDTLASVQHLTEEQLNKPAAPGKWSVSEILSHVVSGERMSLQYIQKKIQGAAQSKDTGLVEELKMLVLKASQRLPGLKFKVPRSMAEHTTVFNNLSAISQEWEQVRNEFKVLLEKIPDEYRHKKIYKHPRAGYLNVKHALIFFREHIIHHTPQIKKLL